MINMKILVVSDSHTHIKEIQMAIDRTNPEMLIFLGDGVDDLKHITLPKNCKIEAVVGNNDFENTEYPIWKVVEVLNHKIFITHGHTFFVPQGVLFIADQAKKLNCEMALFGHTHHRFNETIYGVKCVNPGCICGQFDIIQSYVVLNVSKNNIKIDFFEI